MKVNVAFALVFFFCKLIIDLQMKMVDSSLGGRGGGGGEGGRRGPDTLAKSNSGQIREDTGKQISGLYICTVFYMVT